jgi:flagellar hook-length control protein FliK
MATQSTPQQFEQNPQQQGEQNFRNQNFQPTTGNESQAQPISTGGEVFAANLTATNDVPQTQSTNQTQAPDAPPLAPQEDFDVPAQIVKQARLIRAAENSEMVIKLNPEHLGELTLRVSVSSSGAVNASFHSDNAQVRTIIENSLVQLRQELNNAGLKVENVQVYAGLSDGGGLMNGQGGQAWQQNRRQSSSNRRINLNAIERDVDATAPVNENIASEGVDYSV